MHGVVGMTALREEFVLGRERRPRLNGRMGVAGCQAICPSHAMTPPSNLRTRHLCNDMGEEA